MYQIIYFKSINKIVKELKLYLRISTFTYQLFWWGTAALDGPSYVSALQCVSVRGRLLSSSQISFILRFCWFSICLYVRYRITL